MLTHVGFGGLLTPVRAATAAIVYYGVQSDVVPGLSLNSFYCCKSVTEESEATSRYLRSRSAEICRPGRSF